MEFKILKIKCQYIFYFEGWNNFSGYRVLQTFIEKLTVANDSAERGVKLIQDFTHSCQYEELKQYIMLSFQVSMLSFQENFVFLLIIKYTHSTWKTVPFDF